MKKRILAVMLACLMLTGCGPRRTEPIQAEPETEGAVIAYVPLDDRPDNVGRVVYLAESLGYTLKMPEADDYRTRLKDQPLNENGTQYGDRADLYEWLLEQERSGHLRVSRYEEKSPQALKNWHTGILEEIRRMHLIEVPDSSYARFIREKFPAVWEEYEQSCR